MRLKDITIKRIKLAYEKHGHKPNKNYRFIDRDFGKRYYCPLEVLAVDSGMQAFDWDLILPFSESTNFTAGFDNMVGFDKGIKVNKTTKAYKLGRQMRKAFVPRLK